MFEEGDVVFRHTREQALAAGVLVDVSEMAAECGFRVAVAVTRAVWDGVVTPDPEAEAMGQSVSGRLWDLLWVLRAQIGGGKAGLDTIHFSLIVQDARRRRTVRLKSICGPGDQGEPVVTMMGREED